MPDAGNLIIKQLSEIVDDLRGSTSANGYVRDYDARRIATRARAAIGRYAPPRSTYEDDAAAIAQTQNKSDRWRAEQFGAIAHALRDDYVVGGLTAIEEIVHADLFDDFLDMATELLSKQRVKSVETLSVELRKEGAITEVQRKSVIAWYAQRTEGAHGRSENLDEADVERMIDGIRDYVARHPA